ncbi:MAG TPA: VOC family protein [Acidimicrobiia bacterium]|jgi:catechol 2,3-dioxygenase-like lactoylglutathione lyase family enzyme
MTDTTVVDLSFVPYVFLYVSNLDEARVYFGDWLGFHAIEEDPFCSKYDAGRTLIALNEIPGLPQTVDAGSMLRMHTGDDLAWHAEIADRGVDVAPDASSWEIDSPYGHRIGGFEPHPDTRVPVARRVDDIVANRRERAGGRALGRHPVVSIVQFVTHPATAREFYSDALGLTIAEEHPEDGATIYDCGSLLLEIRALDDVVGDDNAVVPRLSTVFEVSDCLGAVRALIERGVHFPTAPRRGPIGLTASFSDPDGHSYYLYEPSIDALSWPSGAFMRAGNFATGSR